MIYPDLKQLLDGKRFLDILWALYFHASNLPDHTSRIGYRIGANTDTDGSAVVPSVVEKEMVVYSDVPIHGPNVVSY